MAAHYLSRDNSVARHRSPSLRPSPQGEGETAPALNKIDGSETTTAQRMFVPSPGGEG